MLGEYYIKVNDDVYLSGTTILGTIPDSIDGYDCNGRK